MTISRRSKTVLNPIQGTLRDRAILCAFSPVDDCRIKIAIKDLPPGEQQDMWLDFDNPKEEVRPPPFDYVYVI